MDASSAASAVHRPGRGRVFDSIVDAIGDTPIVRLRKLPQAHGVNATILAKLEYFNPAASVKDRIGAAMIIAMEKAGIINADTVLIEPTSGNTGIALAFVAASRGYRLKLVMPEFDVDRAAQDAGVSRRRDRADAGGAGHEGLDRDRRGTGAHDAQCGDAAAVQEPRQSGNPSPHHGGGNLERHRRQHRLSSSPASAPAAPSPASAQVLKPRKPSLRVVAVEPEESPVLSGGQHSPHKIQGIGAGFVPDILDRSVIDEIVKVNSATAIETSRALARNEGIPGGISSGAAIAAALQIGKRPENAGKTILAIVPSFSERYLSTAVV